MINKIHIILLMAFFYVTQLGFAIESDDNKILWKHENINTMQKDIVDIDKGKAIFEKDLKNIRSIMGIATIILVVMAFFLLILYFELKLRRYEIKKRNKVEELLKQKIKEIEEVYTRLRLTSSKLEFEKERYKKIVSHLPTGAVYIEDEMVYLNIELQKNLSINNEKMELKKFIKLIFGDEDEYYLKKYQELKKDNFTIVRDVKIEVEKTEKYFKFMGYKENDLEIWIVDNITDNKEYQEFLKKAKVQAEEANQAKSIFLSNMSHEIRTPLNGIIGTLEVFADTKMDSEQSELYNLLEISAKSLLQIINDILDFSKIEAGKMQLLESQFSIYDVPDSTLGIIRSIMMYEKKDIKLKSEIIGEFPEFLIGDKVKLEQIIINLLTNAYKFTVKGEILLKIELLKKENGYFWAKFTIKDTGIGIAEEKIENLFNRFIQIDSSLNKRYKGTGLGLAIVRGIVELMNGDIEVKSKKDEGTEVNFTIKLKSLEEEINVEKISMHYDIPQNIKILLIEDNKINRDIIRRGLKKFGIEIDMAEDGETGIELIKNRNYNVILLDIQLPDISGYDVCRYIRIKNMSIKILAITAYASTESKKKALDAGMDDYLTKPFKIHDLLKKIETFCQDV